MIPSVCHSTQLSVTQSVHDTVSPSVIPICLSYDQSVCHPIDTSICHPHHQSCDPSSSTIFTSLSECLSPPAHLYDASQSPSACLSPSDSLTATTTCLTACPSSNTIQCTQDSSLSLAVMNGEQSRKSKKFHRAFSNYDLLLCDLDVSSIYPSDSRCVAPPK